MLLNFNVLLNSNILKEGEGSLFVKDVGAHLTEKVATALYHFHLQAYFCLQVTKGGIQDTFVLLICACITHL